MLKGIPSILKYIFHSSPSGQHCCLQSICVLRPASPFTRKLDCVLTQSWCLMLCRVIQMIDENKEQLRSLFRTYNVVDVQPAVSDKLPDDISTLQVCEAGTPRKPSVVTGFFLMLLNFLSLSLLQLVIIILAVLLCLAGILFVTMNWHYRRV